MGQVICSSWRLRINMVVVIHVLQSHVVPAVKYTTGP